MAIASTSSDRQGDTSYPGQTIQRNLISGAFDIHPFESLLIQLNASHANFHIWGNTPYFLGSANAFGMAIPTADPATVRAFPWLQHSDETDIGGVKINWKPNDIFTVRTEWQYTDDNSQPRRRDLYFDHQSDHRIDDDQGLRRRQ